ncbi:MAG TPA: hypothetical protein VFN37_14510 [Candidatus Baltobacteraceae bacterium]|nr:hypothetical protein [Candidatus Baltobacteraceae bacterium]
MLKTLLLFGYVAAGDAVLLLAGLPLQRYALHVALHQPRDTPLIWLLLAANLALLIVIVTAALAGLGAVRRIGAALAEARERTHRSRPHS